MRLLLDTHAFLWWLIDDRQLSQAARQAIADDGNDVLVSAASAWEIATKRRIGRLPAAEALAGNIAGTDCYRVLRRVARQRGRRLPSGRAPRPTQ